MQNNHGFKSISLSDNRQVVIASATVTRQKNTIHAFTEIDITEPRERLQAHFEKHNEKLSFTAYIVTCLAQVVKQHPHLNSFIKGRKQIVLDDVTISVLVERELEGEKVPEPVAIQQAQLKTYREISAEIRAAQQSKSDKLGGLSKHTWIGFIPWFLLKAFVRIADKNIRMAKRYGKVAVTSVGMFSKEAVWMIPHGSATLLISVGSMTNKVVEVDGQFVSREHLCLTASFDHDIVDGAPAMRFLNQLIDTIKSGQYLDL